MLPNNKNHQTDFSWPSIMQYRILLKTWTGEVAPLLKAKGHTSKETELLCICCDKDSLTEIPAEYGVNS